MLRKLHQKWCEKNKWNFSVIESFGEQTIRRSVAKISGAGAFDFFKNEKGVHKLTRVSPYGRGKKHTSCVAVSVFKDVVKTEVAIPEKDLKWDTFRGTGAGGQHRNKRDTAVRLTHLPTNTVVTVLSGRSQFQNKENALAELKERLSKRNQASLHSQKFAEVNREALGFGHQVRSYKLDQHLIKDERTGIVSKKVDAIMSGDLSLFC